MGNFRIVEYWNYKLVELRKRYIGCFGCKEWWLGKRIFECWNCKQKWLGMSGKICSLDPRKYFERKLHTLIHHNKEDRLGKSIVGY